MRFKAELGISIAVLVCVTIWLPPESAGKEILLGTTISIGKGTDIPQTIEAMKRLGANCLITLRQERGEEFRKLCNEVGITVIQDLTGRAAAISKDELGYPDKYYQHSFSGPFFKVWNEYLRKSAAMPGCHFLGCVPDEFTWHNAQLGYTLGITPPPDLPFYATDDETKARFKQETGLDLPSPRRSRILNGRDPAERKFAVFRYRWAIDSMKQWAATIRSTNKDLKVSAVLTSMPTFGLERYPSAMCWDLLGRENFLDLVAVTAFTTCYDYRGLDTHYVVSETAKTLAAAFPPKVYTGVATVLYSVNVEDDPHTVRRMIDGIYLPTPLREVDIYGTHIAAAFHGASVLSCYDGRYVEPSSKNFSQWKADALKRGFDYIRRIEKCLVEGREPPEIVVLISRASEDYYMLDHADISRNLVDDGSAGIWEVGGWAQPANRCSWIANRDQELSKGVRADLGMIRFLMKSGYVFTVKYLDQIETYDLIGAKTIILPMPYCIPAEALPKLKKTVNDGATLIIANQLAELDEQGEPHKSAPLLAELIPVDKGNMVPTEQDKARVSTTDGMTVASVEVGQGSVHFVQDLVMDTSLNPKAYEAARKFLLKFLEKAETVPVPVKPVEDIEAGYRDFGSGGYLGVINWKATPQQAAYRLPSRLLNIKTTFLNLDGSAAGIAVDEKKGAVTFDLDKHDVKGILFH